MKDFSHFTPGNGRVKNAIVVLILLTSSQVWAQLEFTMGVEAGVHSSGLPSRNEWTTPRGASANEKDLPLIRALGGAWGKAKFRKHFYVSIGVQYTTIGSRYSMNQQGYDARNEMNFKSQVREDFTFNKVSYPIVLGYDLQIKKLPVSLFMGYRPASLTSGNYYYMAAYSDDSGLHDYSFEKHIDPFDDANLAIEAHRHLKQVLVGAGVTVNDKFYISFLCSTGEMIAFFERVPSGLWESTGFDHTYDRWDLVLSLKYTLVRFPKIKGQ